MTRAEITGVGGAVNVVLPPPSVAGGVYESDTVIRVFGERDGVVLLRDVVLDSDGAGTWGLGDSPAPTSLSAGTTRQHVVVALRQCRHHRDRVREWLCDVQR